MSAQPPQSRRRAIANVRTVAVLLALSIGAASCGSTETSATPTLATQVTTTTTTTVVEEESAFTPPADEPSAENGDSAVDETETAAPVVNLFPDIDVLNIADGGTVNLATELGGADQATLLWFFAPH